MLPHFHVPGPWAWWHHRHLDDSKAQRSLQSTVWSFVCFSPLYRWAQACSTSAMVFGAAQDRIRGPPLSWITTSSSILTPRPRKRFGTWLLSSLMYNPVRKSEACMKGWCEWQRSSFLIGKTRGAHLQERKRMLTWFYGDGHSWLKRLWARQLRSVVDVHAQVMANMMRAVPPCSLGYTKPCL